MIRRARFEHKYSTLGHHFFVTTDGSGRPELSGEVETLSVPCPLCQHETEKLTAYRTTDGDSQIAVCPVCDWWAYMQVETKFV